jgi:hypothetical protein
VVIARSRLLAPLRTGGSGSGMASGSSRFDSGGRSPGAGVEVVDVQRGTKPGVSLGHYPPYQIQGLRQGGREGELERGGRGFTIPGLGKVGSQKAVDDSGVNFSVHGAGQAVATFDLGQEAPGHEEALLFNRCWKHHIVPQRDSPAYLACGRQVNEAGDARRPDDDVPCEPMPKTESRRKRRKTESRSSRHAGGHHPALTGLEVVPGKPVAGIAPVQSDVRAGLRQEVGQGLALCG